MTRPYTFEIHAPETEEWFADFRPALERRKRRRQLRSIGVALAYVAFVAFWYGLVELAHWYVERDR